MSALTPVPLNVLIVSAHLERAKEIAEALEQAGYAPNWRHANAKTQYLEQLSTPPDIVLVERAPPAFQPRWALDVLRERRSRIPLILIAEEEVSIEQVVAYIKGGAADCVRQSELARLGPAIESALNQQTTSQRQTRLLRRQLKLFQTIIESIPVGVGLINDEGKFLAFNESMLQPGGYTRQDIQALGNVANLYANPEDREQLLTIFQTQGVVRQQAIEFRRKDGGSYTAEINLANVQIEGENYVLAIVQDITHRLQTERKLKETHQRLNAILNSLPDLVFVVTREGRIEEYYAPHDNFLYVPPGDFLGKTVSEVLPTPAAAIIRDAIEEALTQGRSAGAVYPLESTQGMRWYELSAAVMGETSQSNDRVVAIARDITRRVQAETAERKTHELLETIFANTHLMLAYMDREFNFIRVNRAYAQADEHTPDFFVGKNHFDLYPNDENRAIFQRVVESGEPYFAYARPFEYHDRPERGTTYWDWSLVPIKDEQGSVTHLILGVVDVTPRQIAANQLKERERFILLLNKITRAASHALELQTMLQTLADHLGELFNADGCFITLWNETQQRVLPGAAYGHLRDKYHSITVEPGEPSVTAAVLESGQPLVIEDTAKSPFVSQRIASKFPTRTLLGLPMITAGEKLGAVLIAWDDPHDVTPEEINRGKQVASQVALGIARTRLLEETRNRAALMEKLSAAVGRLNRSNTAQDVITETGKALLQLSQADRAGFYLLQDYEFTCAWSYGLSNDYLETVLRNTDEMPGGQLRSITHPILVPDVAEFPKTALIRQLAEKEGYQSAALWPLVFENRTTAVIACYYNQPHYWSETEQEVMEALARQAATALQNARLYEETTQQAAEFAALLELTQLMNAEQDTPALLERIVESAKALLSASEGEMYLYDKERRELEVVVATDESIPLGLRLKLGEGLAGQVALWRKAMMIDDYTTWSGRAASFEGLSVRAVVEAPMLFGGELLGVLVVHETGDVQRTFTEKDVHLLSLLASQAAAVMYNARLLDQLRDRFTESEALRQAAQAVTSTIGLEQAIEQILAQLELVVPYDSAAVMLLNEEDSDEVFLEIVGGRGWADPSTVIGLRFPLLGDNPNSAVIQERRAVILNDAPALYPAFRQPPHSHIRSWLGVPMIADQKVIGMLAIDSTQPNYFTSEHARLASTYTDHVAAAVQNARLYEEARRRAEQMEVIHHLSQQVTSILDADELLQTAAQELYTRFGYLSVQIYLLDQDRRELVAHGIAGTTGEITPGYRQKVGEGITGKAARLGKRVLVTDVRQEPDFIPCVPGIRSELAVPIFTDERLVGVLNVESDKTNAFDQADVIALEALCGQIGAALENARLFEETTQRMEEMQTLTDTAAALRTAGNLAEMTPVIIRQAAQIINGDYGTITLEAEPLDSDAAPGETISQGWYSTATNWQSPLSETEMRFPAGKGISGHVLSTGEIYITHDPMNDPFLLIHPAEEDVFHHIRSLISVPLRAAERVVGVLHIGLARQHTFHQQEIRLLQAIAAMAGNALHRASLHEQLEANYIETVMALANAMDARDTYTQDHSQRLAAWSAATAMELGCSEEEIATIHQAALLHDIGKIGVPDAILRKPGKLTEEEWEIIKRHPQIGADIVAPVAKLQHVAPLIRSHQEKFDGSGYPDGLTGEDIPIGARILAVVDAYSAITDKRPYKEARSHEEAVAELRRCAGSHFDPDVVKAFLKVIGKGG